MSRILRELSKIPFIVITGVLVSGKNTLLGRLLADGLKTTVLINEFGANPIDQDLLLNLDSRMTMPSSSCLYCKVKGALGT